MQGNGITDAQSTAGTAIALLLAIHHLPPLQHGVKQAAGVNAKDIGIKKG